MTTKPTLSASEVLSQFRLAEGIYVVGIFETGLTIYSQQVRALNLAWSMVESAGKGTLKKVAVIGGGFAGLTVAAGLLHKGLQHVALFEKRATLLPLQQGSDARWVHPRIYDWPDKGCDLPTAALPLLNWNAGRASDVVVEILKDWDRLTTKIRNRSGQNAAEVFVNVKHLRLNESREIEWVGERVEADGRTTASGKKDVFDAVVIAIGFGLETNARFLYWRNETLGQPELNPGKRIYLISGHGDGALIDLFRIRITRFRQDRILAELFGEKSGLLSALQNLKKSLDDKKIKPEDLYNNFEKITNTEGFEAVLNALRARLRADTAVVLRMSQSVDSFKKVFASRASFQNRFLLFMLYIAGGVIPARYRKSGEICSEYGIRKEDIIRRHGTKRENALEDVLDSTLWQKSRNRINCLSAESVQTSEISWPGGYWDERSKKLGEETSQTDQRGEWRREYLPSATEVLVTGFLSGVAGYLEARGIGDDFRITLHRSFYIGSDYLLQQTARYLGPTDRFGKPGRVFQLSDGTIGYSARIMQIVRTRQRLANETDEEFWKALVQDMTLLALEKHSQRMNDKVRSVLALPILTQNKNGVLAVLYADSTEAGVFSDECIRPMIKMCRYLGSQIERIRLPRVRNFSLPFSATGAEQSNDRLKVLQTVDEMEPPHVDVSTYLNLEFADFISFNEDQTDA